MRKWVTIGDYEGEAIVSQGENTNEDIGEVFLEENEHKCLEVREKNSTLETPSPFVQDFGVGKGTFLLKNFQSSSDKVSREKNIKEEPENSDSEVSGYHSDVKSSDFLDNKLTEPKIAADADSDSEAANISKFKGNVGKWRSLGLRLKDSKDFSSASEFNSDNKPKTDGENSDEAMDAELPTPEHITSFYDLVKAVKNSNENLSAQEIENKFKQLSLAFKTDRLTLRQRVEVQHRQRDIAEANFEREMAQLRRYIADLHEECMDMDLVDAITQIRKHIEVLTMSSNSLLSASEVWGAVQQEWRVSRALEVLLLHVENVNRLYENDHQELEEMRKLLTEHQIELPSSSGSASSNQSSTTDSANTSRRIRALSLAGIGKQTTENGNRRISLGPGASKSALNQFLVGRSSRRRASMMPDLRPFHQDLASTIEKSLALKAANNVQEKNEENTHSNKGMMNSSITEEGSESGDEGTENGGQDSKNHSPTVTSLRKYNNFPLYGQPLQDNGQMFYDDSSPTPTRSPDTDPLLATNAVVNFVPHSSSWLMQNLEEIYNRFRDGDLPYTNQQVLRGVFTSFLLLVAVFYLVLATSSANDELPEPCLPDWTFKAFRIKFNSHQPF